MKLVLVAFLIIVSSNIFAGSVQIINDLTFYPRQGQSINQSLSKHPFNINLYYTHSGFFQTLTSSDSFNPLKETSLGVFINVWENPLVDNKNLEKIILKAGKYEVQCDQVLIEIDLEKDSFNIAIQGFTLKSLEVEALTQKRKKFKNEGIEVSFAASAPGISKKEISCDGIIKKVLGNLPNYVISDNMVFIN